MKGVQFIKGFQEMERWAGDRIILVVTDDMTAETDESSNRLSTADTIVTIALYKLRKMCKEFLKTI